MKEKLGQSEKEFGLEQNIERAMEQVYKSIKPIDGKYDLKPIKMGLEEPIGKEIILDENQGSENVEKVFKMIVDEAKIKIKDEVDLKDFKRISEYLKRGLSFLQFEPKDAARKVYKDYNNHLAFARPWILNSFIYCSMLKNLSFGDKPIDSREVLFSAYRTIEGSNDRKKELFALRANKLIKILGREKINPGVDKFFRTYGYSFNGEKQSYQKREYN